MERNSTPIQSRRAYKISTTRNYEVIPPRHFYLLLIIMMESSLAPTAKRAVSADLELLWSMLTEDLIHKILCKLPLKALIRVSSLNKKWNAFTRSPLFREAYRKASCQKPMWVFMAFMKEPRNRLGIFDPTLNGWHLGFTTPFVQERAYVHGYVAMIASAVGLLCITIQNSSGVRFFTFNPLTKLHRKLPLPTDVIISGLPILGYMFPTADSKNYKLLIAGSRNHSKRPAFKTSLYDSETNSWRRCGRLPALDYPEPFNGNGVLLDGHLYFLATVKYQLVAFNLEKLVWSILECESEPNYLRDCFPCLLGHRGSLYAAGHVGPLYERGGQDTNSGPWMRLKLKRRMEISKLDWETMRWERVASMPCQLYKDLVHYVSRMKKEGAMKHVVFGYEDEVYFGAVTGHPFLTYSLKTKQWRRMPGCPMVEEHLDVVRLEPSLDAVP